jgi:hypothetical protein
MVMSTDWAPQQQNPREDGDGEWATNQDEHPLVDRVITTIVRIPETETAYNANSQ